MERTRLTPDADIRHVYHNCSIAIDAARRLFNGAPGVVAAALDACGLRRGDRFLHVGAGLGYYSAVAAHCVGETGYVLAIEVDGHLAAAARENLAHQPWVEVQHGDGAMPLSGAFDVIFVSAGLTHPLDTWLDALAPGGRLLLPPTASMPAMGAIGKGFMFLLTKSDSNAISARALTMTAIYPAVGLRDRSIEEQLGRALMRTPFPGVTRLRREAHEPTSACWLHSQRFCLSGD